MSNLEVKICQNCHNQFEIEPEDFAFYERIKVPPPTWCPECRIARRMMFRNERSLYRRNCDLCKKSIVSVYSTSSPFTVYCYDCFYSDKWDPLSYGQEYDFRVPFFKQFFELQLKVPKLAQQKSPDLLNCEYVNHMANSKNCYLTFASVNDEDCYYCNYVSYSKDIYDGLRVFKSNLGYNCVDCYESYDLKFSQQCQSCVSSWFLYNCRGCTNCFMCSNLIQKSYCFRNKQYSKQEYEKLLEKINTGDEKVIEELKRDFLEIKINSLKKAVEGVDNYNSTGNYLNHTKSCRNCFDVSNSENCRYVVYGNNLKEVVDSYAAYPTTELSYEVAAIGATAYHCLFTYLSWEGAVDQLYCINAFPACQNCFGCNQIRNKQYCILNKQYTKEEYESLVPKIIDHMNKMPYIDKKGRVYKYGEFFPPELSPFAYNETIAQEYFPLTKEQALAQGYRWKDPEERNIKPDYYTKDLADHIKDVKDDILGKIIQCAHSQIKEDGSLEANCNEQCTTAFKIIPQELEFYRRMNLPLPRLCPNCRHFQRLKQRNPLKLWHRKCQCQGTYGQNPNNSNIYQNQTTHFHQNKPCSNEFYTSYAPDRPEIVYCDKCYNKELL